MVLRRLGALLLGAMACVPPGREPLEVPIVLTVSGALEQPAGEAFAVDRARVSVADLVLRGDVDDAHPAGEVVATWAGERAVDLLGTPGRHGTLRAQEGPVRRAAFSVRGDPAVVLEGVRRVGDDEVPFRLEAALDAFVDEVPLDVLAPLDAAVPPGRLLWTVDLEAVLGDLPLVPREDGAAWTVDDVGVREALEASWARPEVWSLRVE